MKITELIKELQGIKKQYGDLNIYNKDLFGLKDIGIQKEYELDNVAVLNFFTIGQKTFNTLEEIISFIKDELINKVYKGKKGTEILNEIVEGITKEGIEFLTKSRSIYINIKQLENKFILFYNY